MIRPILDGRTSGEIREKLKALAASYTPEWRFERAEDDPGAALAELYADMYAESVDRFNALPEKLYIEFLNMIGFQEPGPVSAGGTMCFEPQSSESEPFTVTSGTQVFTPDEEGENVVFETDRTIQITPARLIDVYYADPKADTIRRLDLDERPQAFFEPVGEELQHHRFSIGENHVLDLECPARVTLTFHPENGDVNEAAELLADESLEWSYRFDGLDFPFTSAHAENGKLILDKTDNLRPEPDENGRICISCTGHPKEELRLDAVELASEPLSPCAPQSMYSDDVPVPVEEGGYCFGRRPAVYNAFYLRCDTALTKRGADVLLRLDLAPIVDEPEKVGVRYDFTQPIIDKKNAVEQKADDVFVSHVVWEYYNGLGWKNLTVTGDKNPFSCRREGTLDVRFTVPEDAEEAEVNAETGYYIRARVAEVENQFAIYQRWIVPLVKSASFQWSYSVSSTPECCYSENNGVRSAIEDARDVAHLAFPALVPMEQENAAMFLRFDASPHAMPLSLRFQVEGRASLHGQLLWDYWNGKGFEPVRTVDQTDRMLHSGEIFLFLTEPLSETDLFGQTGCWLRLSLSGRETGVMPTVAKVTVNAVSAHQRQRETEQVFDTEIYEAGKRVYLLSLPVQECRVWVDEMLGISAAEIERLRRDEPARVRLEYEDHQLKRCWVEWERVADLALASPGDRVFALEPYQGEISFGDGRQGRVPPQGDHNIRVEYSSGGGERGNVPPDAIRSLLTAVPQVGELRNITAMSGGTGRPKLEDIAASGSNFLRNRGRAAGRRDYEELVRRYFPQVSHVRCFSGRNERGERAPGHITVVLTGFGKYGEGTEELCRQVYRFLSERSSCCLITEGRLHVCPATVLTVNTSVTVDTEIPELSAEVQRDIVQRLETLIGETWKARPIGEQIRLSEIWSAVRDTPNVRLIRRILVEASYDRDGRKCLSALEADNDFPYGVAESGRHLVRLI